MKLHIHPHPAIILVLCGLPLFGYTAWKFYTGGAVRELTLEVDADNQVTVKARRLWVTQVRPAFGIEKLRLFETMKGFAREAHRDQDNLPDLPVRIALADGTSADALWQLLVLVMRTYLWEVTLESPERTVAFELPKDESGVGIPLPGKPRSLDVASVSLPSAGDGGWAVEELAFGQVHVTRRDIERLSERSQRRWSEKAKKLAVTFDLDRSWVDVRSPEDWEKVVKRADRARARTVGAVEEVDFSGFDAVGIRWGKSALARDLVRAIAAIKANEPAPRIILVVPDPE